MKVSILISSYNGRGDIPLLMESIKNLVPGSHDLEVVLRDDNSRDGTPHEVVTNYPWVKLIAGTRNVGFAKSNNIAFRHATGDVICCLNQDTILDRHFLEEGLDIFENRPEVAAVNTNMIMPWVLTLDEFQNTPPERLPAYEYQLTPYGFARYSKVGSVVKPTNFLTGGGFFIRRSALDKEENLFDPNISMYCEDTDLSLRLIKQGALLVYAPMAILYHAQVPKEGGSLHEFKKLIKITGNRFRVFSRHASPSDLLKTFPLLTIGIVKKMQYLGLPKSRLIPAFILGGCIAIPFSCLLPLYLVDSLRFHRGT